MIQIFKNNKFMENKIQILINLNTIKIIVKINFHLKSKIKYINYNYYQAYNKKISALLQCLVHRLLIIKINNRMIIFDIKILLTNLIKLDIINKISSSRLNPNIKNQNKLNLVNRPTNLLLKIITKIHCSLTSSKLAKIMHRISQESREQSSKVIKLKKTI